MVFSSIAADVVTDMIMHHKLGGSSPCCAAYEDGYSKSLIIGMFLDVCLDRTYPLFRRMEHWTLFFPFTFSSYNKHQNSSECSLKAILDTWNHLKVKYNQTEP